MKKTLLLVLILIPIWLWAQDMPFAVKNKTRFSSSGMVGYETIDSLRYYRARLIQEFKVWKIGVGLDLDFLFDRNYRLRTSDWDDWMDVLDKFYYIRYGKRDEPVFVHVGGFPDFTIGHGLVMQKYSNMELYSQYRNLGLMLGTNLPMVPTQPSFELFDSNLKRNEILSFSGRFKPIPDSTVAVLDDMVVGFTLAHDRNQYGNLRYLAADDLQEEVKELPRRSVTVMGVAINQPLVKQEKFALDAYTEFAHIGGLGTGFIIPGLSTTFWFTKIDSGMKINLEYRRYSNAFTPSFFDEDYEEERGYYDYERNEFMTKKKFVKGLGPANGINGEVELNLKRRVKTSVKWQNIIGEDYKNGKSLWLKLWVDTQWGRLENFSLGYSRTKQERLSIRKFYDPGTKANLAMTFRLGKRWYFIAKYAETYKDKDGDGQVNWLKETKHSFGAGLKYLH
ncbi:MAG: hypothetical protein WCY64_03690 [Candidatus Cloacimonadaceae bacterium]